MYSREKLIKQCQSLAHGKVRISGLREATRQAEQNNDIKFQMACMVSWCDESMLYEDAMEMLTVFPKLLALADKNPNMPTTEWDPDQSSTMMDQVLWIYKGLLAFSSDYYQISKADCEYFYEDYKRRLLERGYSLRDYYLYKYFWNKNFNEAKADEYFYLYRNAPIDENTYGKEYEILRCVAFYLDKQDLDNADIFMEKLSKFKQGQINDYWRRAKIHYMWYYAENRQLDKLWEYINTIHKYHGDESKYDIYTAELFYYSYVDISKALGIYKKNWKKLFTERNPQTLFSNGIEICIFFKKLMESRKTDNIKIQYDTTFPLYKQDNIYKISQLYDFYYKFVFDIADKFDKRNENDFYKNKLQHRLHNV